MVWKRVSTEVFDKDFFSLDNSERIRVEKKLLKLKDDPYQGKPLGYE